MATEPTSARPESDLDRLSKRWNAPWLGKPEDVLKIKDENLRKAVISVGVRPDGMNTPDVLSTDYLHLQGRVLERIINEEESDAWLALIAREFEQRSASVRGDVSDLNSTEMLQTTLRQLKEEDREFYLNQIELLRSSLDGFNVSQVANLVSTNVANGMKGLEALQTAQNELMRRAGFSGFVSAMDARAGINVQQFDTELPVWYDSLSQDWKKIIRTNLGTLLGAYLKFRSAVMGAENIIKSEDIAIYKESLAKMWNQMPGYRVVTATMTHDLFISGKDKMYLSGDGVKRLQDLPKYKEELIAKVSNYIKSSEKKLLEPKGNGGGPEHLSPDLAARFAVSAVWNFIYLGNNPDSGDSIVPGDPNSKGKQLQDVQAFCPSVRAFFLPWDQARSKYILGEEQIEGTDEGWGGPMGDWMAERIRHNSEFKRMFINKEGVTKLMPERLMFSLFDLTTFEDKTTISQALLCNDVIDLGNGLYDYADPSKIDFNKLKYAELWGGYSDSMDSAWKIYNAILGRADKEFDITKLGNALSKLRKTDALKEIYTGEKGEMILAACVIGMLGGPQKYTSEVILNIDDSAYDVRISQVLSDDRLFASLPKGSRNRLLKLLHASDLNNLSGVLGAVVKSLPMVGERTTIRQAAGKEAERYLSAT